ncbi:aldo/keto reductase [Agromyces allii]|uniref:Aldo/keto reductase n=1 Tax=Agromyces allii TaxID=393607 RepID=A0ABN2Q8P4_9MICO|nr:aldo/keto reductase [Agromyces allii]
MARRHLAGGRDTLRETDHGSTVALAERDVFPNADAAGASILDEPRTAAHRAEVVTSNTFSGPILVPLRAKLGDTDMSVHRLAIGASTFGWTLGSEDAYAILDRFAGTGGDLIDTADSYAAGRSESIIGSWMASRGSRDRMHVMTKVGRNQDLPGLAPQTIRAAVDASLQRLRTDRIDVLYLHGEDPEVPLEESLGAVGALVDAGKVRAVGASDFGPERLIEARVLAANGLPRFQTLTTRYSLMERSSFEGATELVAHAQGLAVMPYFALANGFLAGGVRRRSDVKHDARGARAGVHLGRRGLRVLGALDAIAATHAVAPATVALAWLLARPTVVAPVVSATNADQVDALIAAASVELHRSELVELDRASH